MAAQDPVRRLDGAARKPVPRPHFEITADAVWFRLQETARRDSVDIRDLGELAEQHPDVRDAILRAANEAERAPIRPFDDVTRAMVFVGLQRLRQMFSERYEALAKQTREAALKGGASASSL